MKQIGPLTKCRQARPWKAHRVSKDDRSLPVELPFGAAVHATGLYLPSSLTEDQWAQIGACLYRVHEASQWALGDWWAFGDWKYRERAAEARARAIPYAFETLMNFGWVARQVATSLRREDLSFSHHAVVARLEADEQRSWLERAARTKLSVKQLRRCLGDRASNRLDHDELARAHRLYDQLLTAAQRASSIDPWEVGPAEWKRNVELDLIDAEQVRRLIAAADQAATAWAGVANGLRQRMDQRHAQEPSAGEQTDAA